MWYPYPPDVSHKIITPHRAGALVGDLHRLLIEEVFGKQQGEGWHSGLSSFVMNALSFALLKRIYIAADEAGTFNEAHQRAQRDLPYLIIGFNAATESAGILYDYVERWCVLDECFNDEEIVDAFIEKLGGQFFLTQFACTLKNDAVSAFYIRRDVEAVIIFIELRRRIAERASTEIVSRFRDFPEIVQKMIGMYGDTDELRQSQHWGKVWDYTEISARKHQLSDEGKDKIWDLIKDRLNPLSDTDLRSQLVWIEENHKGLKYFPKHIKDRAKGIKETEQRDAKRFQSFDEEDSPLIEIIPDSSVRPPDALSIRLGMPLTHSQRERVKEAFRRVKGADPETGVMIVEYMVKNYVVFTKTGTIKKSEIVEGLECEGKKIAPSTVGLYLGTKKRRGFIRQIANELVEILRRKEP